MPKQNDKPKKEEVTTAEMTAVGTSLQKDEVAQPKSAKSGVVEVNEGTLRELIQQNSEISNQNADLIAQVKMLSNALETTQGAVGMRPVLLDKKKETLLKVRTWNDKIFLGYENVGNEKRPRYVYSEYNPTTREQIEFCNIILRNDDGSIEKPLKVKYADFMLDSNIIELKQIKRIELEEEVVRQGIVPKKEFQSNGYGSYLTDVNVPVDVRTKNYSYLVKLEDDTELELPASALG